LSEKAAWVRAGAAEVERDPDAVELNTMMAKSTIGDHAGAARRRRTPG
jgi:hypothetical protein